VDGEIEDLEKARQQKAAAQMLGVGIAGYPQMPGTFIEDYHLKYTAITMASQIYHGSGIEPSYVVEAAKRFEAYLKTGE